MTGVGRKGMCSELKRGGECKQERIMGGIRGERRGVNRRGLREGGKVEGGVDRSDKKGDV